jgi:hypothetical protein
VRAGLDDDPAGSGDGESREDGGAEVTGTGAPQAGTARANPSANPATDRRVRVRSAEADLECMRLLVPADPRGTATCLRNPEVPEGTARCL